MEDLVELVRRDKSFSTFYHEITETLGFAEEKDREARNLIRSVILSKEPYDLGTQISMLRHLTRGSNQIWVFGGGPGAEVFLKNYREQVPKQWLNETLIIAIDGATRLLMKFDIVPDVIFSDLDGIRPKDLQKKAVQDAFLVVHAHGDNMDKIKLFTPILKQWAHLIATTQTESALPVINHGGFTDGDRALFLIDNFVLNKQPVFLFGYDFGSVVGSHSKPEYAEDKKANSMKATKMRFGRQLTEKLCSSSIAEYDIIACGERIHAKCEVSEIFNFNDFKNLYLDKQWRSS